VPDPREQQPTPDDLTEEEKEVDPSSNHPDTSAAEPEKQSDA
jgi:hypothetical protein